MMEPDCSGWTQEVNYDHDYFERRCDALMYLTSGDMRAAYPFLKKIPKEDHVSLMLEVLDFTFFMMAIDKPNYDYDTWLEDDKTFVECWDEYFDYKSSFKSRDDIIHHLCTNDLVKEAGEDLLHDMNCCDLSDWGEVDHTFYKYVNMVMGEDSYDGCGGAYDSDDPERPIVEGGSGRVVDYKFKDQETYDVGFVILSPFPGIRPKEDSSRTFKKLCESFNEEMRKEWIFNQWGHCPLVMKPKY